MWTLGENVVERRYELQLERMLAQAEVPAELTERLLTRLDEFVLPFTAALVEPEQRWHTVEYMTGLLSKLDHKTGEGIAYLHDQERQGLQKFIGHVPWEHQPLLLTLSRQVGADLGAPDGVIVFDPSAFAKKGTKSVGVARQWCGRLGKVENCQVGVYMGYVSRKDHAIVTTRLYLPKEWAKDRGRRKEAGVPGGSRSAPVTGWRWKCSTSRARSCRTPGWRGTTRWAGRRASAGNCGGVASATCWRSRRTPWSATSTSRRRTTRGGAAGPRARSRGWTGAAPGSRKPTGPRSRCATARRGRWWSRR